jgi:hypothetical protein
MRIGRILQHDFSPGAALLASSLLSAPLSAQEFHPLFDGFSLQGWHLQGHGEWKASGGMLVGTHVRTDARYGHLVSDSAYRDFTLRYRWKLVQGNSGLYYHSAEGNDAHEGNDAGMIGPQVEMDEAYPGGIYTTSTDPWGWVVQPDSKDIVKWYRPGDWNQVTVTAKGARVTVAYNGIQTAETADARLPASGHFGFQLHAHLDCEILIDDVEIALPGTVAIAPPGGSAPRARFAPAPGGLESLCYGMDGSCFGLSRSARAGIGGDASETRSSRWFRVDGTRVTRVGASIRGN